jgi:hypothetical protein
MASEESKIYSPEPEKSLDKAIADMEAAILEKSRSEGFENYNDAENFLVEQFEKFFPGSLLVNDFKYNLAWNEETLCIFNVCYLNHVNVESDRLRFTDWDSKSFQDAAHQFLSTPK